MGLFARKTNTRPTNSASRASHASSKFLNLHEFSSASSKSSHGLSRTSGFFKTAFSFMMPKMTLPKYPDPDRDPAGYLRSIHSVRERCSIVLAKAKKDELNHFDVDMSKFKGCTRFVVSIIKRDFAPDYSVIPPHGRWQHFNVRGQDRIEQLLSLWSTDANSTESCRRLLDLFLVSVLLDAGAGLEWSYVSKEDGRKYRRSEGLAIASLEMFKDGIFSSDPTRPHQVDSKGLRRLTVEKLAEGLQVWDGNPIAGLEGRTGLLVRLADALENSDFFGIDARPGNMLDYLISHPTTQVSSEPIVLLPTLWTILMDGLAPIWPASRTNLLGTYLGDAWPLSTMPCDGKTKPWETIVPFHKLTQWLCYSIMQPMSKLMHIQFAGAELMTGLPEYRNGGLFIDMGVLTLKASDQIRGLSIFREERQKGGKASKELVPTFTPDDDVIVEWRAVTVGFLDLLLEEVNSILQEQGQTRLTLPQLLEAGSWKGGREMAEISRPCTHGPPIDILSDGTIF